VKVDRLGAGASAAYLLSEVVIKRRRIQAADLVMLCQIYILIVSLRQNMFPEIEVPRVPGQPQT